MMVSTKKQPGRKSAPDPAAQALHALRAMLADPRRGTPAWREVAEAMASDYEAPDAWRLIGGDCDVMLLVVDLARQSLEAARAEARRPTTAIERKAIERVRKLACDLRAAIKASALPGDTVYPVIAGDRPNAEVEEIGWHSLRAGGYLGRRHMAVCDVLEWVEREAERALDTRPARAVSKRKQAPEQAAFVRLLAWHFEREFGQQMPSAVGRVASALFRDRDPIDARQVEGILKDRPSYLAPPRKRRARPVT